jgi:hypothetical protein
LKVRFDMVSSSKLDKTRAKWPKNTGQKRVRSCGL